MQAGPHTIFWTLSYAEYHWSQFQSLFNESETFSSTSYERRQKSFEYARVLVWIFCGHVDVFKKNWLNVSLSAIRRRLRYEFLIIKGVNHCYGLAKPRSDLIRLTVKVIFHILEIFSIGWLTSIKNSLRV